MSSSVGTTIITGTVAQNHIAIPPICPCRPGLPPCQLHRVPADGVRRQLRCDVTAIPSGDSDIGGDVVIRLDEDGGGLIWRHSPCRAWMTLRYQPDPRSTGHVLVEQWPNLTIEGSLLCPAGCGKHGWIRGGRWVTG